MSVCAVVNGSLDLAARAIVLQAFLFDEAKLALLKSFQNEASGERRPRRTLRSHDCQHASHKPSVHAAAFPLPSPPFASPLLFSSCIIRQQREYHCQGLGFRCLVLCVEPELSPCAHLEKHTNSTNNTHIVIQKKKNGPLPAFPPSLSLIPPY